MQTAINLTFSKLIDASIHVQKKFDLLNTDLKTLSIEYLKYLFETNELEFKALRNLYVKTFKPDPSQNIPEPENDFHAYICRTYLHIEANTVKEKTFEILQKITFDLREIEADKIRYQTELDSIESPNRNFEEGDNYHKKLLIHYLRKLDAAKEQILNYTRNKLPNFINQNRHISIFDETQFLYHYRIDRASYKKEALSEIANKLFKVSVYRYFELEKIYRNDKKKFLKEVNKDIKTKDILESIKTQITQHYLLKERENIILEVLELYQTKKYELFCNIVPQLIEGLFYDFCLENGIKEASLIQSTLVDKIELLYKIKNHQISITYEYFTFIFPVIRNRVAHGKKLNVDLNLLSWTLLMDLNYVIEMFKSSSLSTNKKINLINDAYRDSQLYKLILLAEVISSPLPNFYKKENSRLAKLKLKLLNDLTAENFLATISNLKDSEKRGLKEGILLLKKIGINQSECSKILKQL